MKTLSAIILEKQQVTVEDAVKILASVPALSYNASVHEKELKKPVKNSEECELTALRTVKGKLEVKVACRVNGSFVKDYWTEFNAEGIKDSVWPVGDVQFTAEEMQKALNNLK